MAVRVEWENDRAVAICDTPAEAMELLRQSKAVSNGAKQSHLEASRTPREEKPKSAEDKIDAFFSYANDKGKNLMKTLLEHRSGVEGNKVCDILGIDASGLGGITGSISKAAKRAKLNVDQIVVSEMRFEGTRRYRWMAPGKLLLEHGEKL